MLSTVALCSLLFVIRRLVEREQTNESIYFPQSTDELLIFVVIEIEKSRTYIYMESDANDPMRSIFNDCALKRASFLLVDFNLRETSFAVSDIGYEMP
ncbi:hypothetical protein T05_4805 [Trichinella murrelli]|uniref:Uncharacterized protein n=1 Tax=Trichinella murrelli TaxID=144512 RepID=A0A0V0TVE1_9BILA|nr:hypothetical protein T05_4805 [Trichinella murrelli]